MLSVMLAAATAMQFNSGVGAKDMPRIVVQGYGSVKTPPNVAKFTYVARGEGRTSDDAVSTLAKRSAEIERALRSIDPSLDLHSDSVTIQTVRGSDCKEDRYEETVHLSTGACATVGYVATQDFDARTSRVRDAGTFVGLAGRHGATNPRIEAFDLVDERGAKRAAIDAALKDAQAKAEAVAAGSHSRVGGVLAVSLDGATNEDLLNALPASQLGLRASAERDEPIPVSVDPKPVETTARVTVSYAIAH
jgi:uncharacterized protein YggE